jgi:hypothetical protein
VGSSRPVHCYHWAPAVVPHALTFEHPTSQRFLGQYILNSAPSSRTEVSFKSSWCVHSSSSSATWKLRIVLCKQCGFVERLLELGLLEPRSDKDSQCCRWHCCGLGEQPREYNFNTKDIGLNLLG